MTTRTKVVTGIGGLAVVAIVTSSLMSGTTVLAGLFFSLPIIVPFVVHGVILALKKRRDANKSGKSARNLKQNNMGPQQVTMNITIGLLILFLLVYCGIVYHLGIHPYRDSLFHVFFSVCALAPSILLLIIPLLSFAPSRCAVSQATTHLAVGVTMLGVFLIYFILSPVMLTNFTPNWRGIPPFGFAFVICLLLLIVWSCGRLGLAFRHSRDLASRVTVLLVILQTVGLASTGLFFESFVVRYRHYPVYAPEVELLELPTTFFSGTNTVTYFDNPRRVDINVDRRGRISISRRDLTLNLLGDVADQIVKYSGKETPILLAVDGTSSFGSVWRVLNQMASRGMNRQCFLAKRMDEDCPYVAIPYCVPNPNDDTTPRETDIVEILPEVIRLNRQQVSLALLEEYLKMRQSDKKDETVIIVPSDATSHRRVIAVMDELNKIGTRKILIMKNSANTQPGKSGLDNEPSPAR